MEKFDRVRDAVLHEQALCLPPNQFCRGGGEGVGQKPGGLFVSQVLDRNLPDRLGISLERDLLVVDAWCLVGPGDVF